MPTTGQKPELLSSRARDAVRDLAGSLGRKQIHEYWQDEGFPAAPAASRRTEFAQFPNQARSGLSQFQGYLDAVDWTDAEQVARALRVFEAALHGLFSDREVAAALQDVIVRLRRLFARDGYDITGDGRILRSPATTIGDDLLGSLKDPSALQEHLARIDRAVGHDDPSLAIGSAKELIESTAKLVLRSLGEPVPARAKLPDLVQRVQTRLRIHPQAAVDGPDSSNSVKKILGAVTTIPTGVAELRNAGFGTGHGGDSVARGLSNRHARLVLNATRTWCEFVLDTLNDETAPWRRASLGAAKSDDVQN